MATKKFSKNLDLHKGLLTQYGYDPTDENKNVRRRALAEAVDAEGWQRIVKALTVVGNLTKNSQPTHSKRYHADAHWVEREYGNGK